MNNKFKTVLLMTALTMLLLLLGELIGGRHGMAFALIFAAGMNFFSYWFSDKVVLAMYRAQPIKKEEYPELFDIVRRLTERAGLPMPSLYMIPRPEPNAFATGRNPSHAAVAVTEGILSLLNREELTGVIAHELSHVKNRDILVSSIAATIAGAIMYVSSMMRWAAMFGGFGSRDDDDRGGPLGLIVAMIVAPIAAMLIQMAISRSREYLADESGAEMSGRARGLASALRKLSEYNKNGSMPSTQATAHMFIVNPLSGKSFANLFSTHPPTEDRIKRLEAMQI